MLYDSDEWRGFVGWLDGKRQVHDAQYSAQCIERRGTTLFIAKAQEFWTMTKALEWAARERGGFTVEIRCHKAVDGRQVVTDQRGPALSTYIANGRIVFDGRARFSIDAQCSSAERIVAHARNAAEDNDHDLGALLADVQIALTVAGYDHQLPDYPTFRTPLGVDLTGFPHARYVGTSLGGVEYVAYEPEAVDRLRRRLITAARKRSA